MTFELSSVVIVVVELFLLEIKELLSSVVLFSLVSLIERLRLPNDGSDLPDGPGQYAGWQPSRHVLTVASNTKKFDSGILNALNLASNVSPSRNLSSSGKTYGSTGHLWKL